MTEKQTAADTTSSDSSIKQRQSPEQKISTGEDATGGKGTAAKPRATSAKKPTAKKSDTADSEAAAEPTLAELNVRADAKHTIDEKQEAVRAEHASAADKEKAEADAKATKEAIDEKVAQAKADAEAAEAGKHPDAENDPEIAEKEKGKVRGHDTRASVTDLAPGSDVADQDVAGPEDEPDYLVSPPELYTVEEDTTIPNLCEKLGLPTWREVARLNGFSGGQFDVTKGTKLRMPAGYTFK